MHAPLARLALLALLSASTSAQIVPRPRVLELEPDVRAFPAAVVCSDAELSGAAHALVDSIGRLGVALGEGGADAATPTVRFARAEDLADEAYAIELGSDGVVVRASTNRGAARAAATLVQLATLEGERVSFPGGRIEDHPSDGFRCFMVDMGRNPHSPAALRALVDMVWFYKGNLLHLHLSDDQRFSWPSRAFPNLVSADAGWTWDDFVELEAYARARGVALVPEIDVPGHSTILRREYPEVFGTTPTELASLESAQRGMETLLDEILSVLSSTPYVHIGGDEAYGVPAGVQRDFLNRLDAHVRAGGRTTVAWEGPPLGEGDDKVSTDVVHMNWRTIEFPAQEMLDAGYAVVNAAWDPMYVVDHYPRTMFTAVDLERCFGWDPRRFGHVDPGMPTFARPHRTETADGILGFCMPWWEGREENLFALCLPRFAAVAAPSWNREGERDFADFTRRQRRLLPRFVELADIAWDETPYADPETQRDNLAYRATVTPSRGAAQPHFGPERLTNGIPDRFDHFLGFPTKPEPLTIRVDLRAPATVGRVRVHERAVGSSHEVYTLEVSTDGTTFLEVGRSGEGTRGDASFVDHVFDPREITALRITTQGCHGLTFPSFSRLTEVEAFADGASAR